MAPAVLRAALRRQSMLHASPRVRLVSEPVPVGDVSLAPAAATGRSEAELAQAAAPQSDAEALRVLRLAFPHSPLAARLGALAAMLRRAAHWH